MAMGENAAQNASLQEIFRSEVQRICNIESNDPPAAVTIAQNVQTPEQCLAASTTYIPSGSSTTSVSTVHSNVQSQTNVRMHNKHRQPNATLQHRTEDMKQNKLIEGGASYATQASTAIIQSIKTQNIQEPPQMTPNEPYMRWLIGSMAQLRIRNKRSNDAQTAVPRAQIVQTTEQVSAVSIAYTQPSFHASQPHLNEHQSYTPSRQPNAALQHRTAYVPQHHTNAYPPIPPASRPHAAQHQPIAYIPEPQPKVNVFHSNVHRSQLHMGPYQIVKRGPKGYTLKICGKPKNVVIDRGKPVFSLHPPQSVLPSITYPQSQRRAFDKRSTFHERWRSFGDNTTTTDPFGHFNKFHGQPQESGNNKKSTDAGKHPVTSLPPSTYTNKSGRRVKFPIKG